MLSELHFENVDNAHRELSRRFERLRKARASREPKGIQQAEMEYYQSLQHLYAAVQDAVADESHQPRWGNRSCGGFPCLADT